MYPIGRYYTNSCLFGSFASGIIYATDWVYILNQATIVMVAPIVVFFYLPFFRRLNVATAYEYLEKRFNLALCLFCGAAFFLMQLGRMGIVLYLPAVALATVTDFNVYACILVMGIFCTIYTVADVWVVVLGNLFANLVPYSADQTVIQR